MEIDRFVLLKMVYYPLQLPYVGIIVLEMVHTGVHGLRYQQEINVILTAAVILGQSRTVNRAVVTAAQVKLGTYANLTQSLYAIGRKYY